MWPVSQLAPRALFCDHPRRAIHCLHENTIAYGEIKVNRGWQGILGGNAGERTCAQQTDCVGLAVDGDHNLHSFGVEFAIDVEQL